jgi:hypothetical protein
VALVRDGRAVAYSLSRVDWWEGSTVWWHGGTPATWRAQGGDPWELCARNWVEDLHAMEGGLAQVPDERVLRLSYESFVADPLGTLERAARFVGLERSSAWMRAVSDLRFPNRNEAWREALDEETIRTITQVQKTDLERYGYV